jgi:hypothetical protein
MKKIMVLMFFLITQIIFADVYLKSVLTNEPVVVTPITTTPIVNLCPNDNDSWSTIYKKCVCDAGYKDSPKGCIDDIINQNTGDITAKISKYSTPTLPYDVAEGKSCDSSSSDYDCKLYRLLVINKKNDFIVYGIKRNFIFPPNLPSGKYFLYIPLKYFTYEKDFHTLTGYEATLRSYFYKKLIEITD